MVMFTHEENYATQILGDTSDTFSTTGGEKYIDPLVEMHYYQ